MFEHFLSRSERHLEHRRSHGEWMWRLRKPQRYVGGFVPPPPAPPLTGFVTPRKKEKKKGEAICLTRHVTPPQAGVGGFPF